MFLSLLLADQYRNIKIDVTRIGRTVGSFGGKLLSFPSRILPSRVWCEGILIDSRYSI